METLTTDPVASELPENETGTPETDDDPTQGESDRLTPEVVVPALASGEPTKLPDNMHAPDLVDGTTRLIGETELASMWVARSMPARGLSGTSDVCLFVGLPNKHGDLEEFAGRCSPSEQIHSMGDGGTFDGPNVRGLSYVLIPADADGTRVATRSGEPVEGFELLEKDGTQVLLWP
ncbi:hypothetical protein, partial [Flaviflexus sp.]